MNSPKPEFPPMRAYSRPQKTVGGVYGTAVLGLLLGIFGLHRLYLRQYFYGAVLSAVGIAGVLLVVGQYIAAMGSMLSGLSVALSGSGNMADIPDVSNLATMFTQPPPKMLLGFALSAAGLVWFVCDMLFVPGAVAKYNAGG